MSHRNRIALAFALALAAGRLLAENASPPAGADRNAWPKTIPMSDGSITVEQPRAESLGAAKLTAHGLIRVKRSEAADEKVGEATYAAEVAVDRDARTLKIVSVQVSNLDLEGVRPQFRERVSRRVGMVLSKSKPELSLDEVLADARFAGRKTEKPAGLKNDPPKIVFENEPAILVTFDGEPKFRAVDGSKLERAMNTPFLVLRDPGSSECFLNGGTSWFRAADPSGPWTLTDDPPSDAVKIAKHDLEEGGVKESEVAEAKKAQKDVRTPKILVATEPTELVVADGEPRWKDVVPGELSTIDNSDSDVFKTASDGRVWLVLSGRWFRSASLSGPWEYVEPNALPAAFATIPEDSERADALAFVPGTAAANKAVEEARMPTTAAIKRSDAKFSATYDGDPQFEPIQGTHVEYAVNSPQQILKIGGRFYACDDGVWFGSKSSEGPWQVADSIPEEDIQTIPPDSPAYNTRYVSVYDSTPEYVYDAYTPAYLGSYPYGGAVVFGTGWRYRPWWGAAYYPRFWTWGFHPRFLLGAGWGYGFGWGPAWGGFRYGFGFGWGRRWCGPGGFFHPGWRNVNVTRNFNRNVTVNRNLYHSGANRTRTASTARSSANRGAAGTHQAGARSAGGRQAGHSAGVGAKGGAGAKPQAGARKGGAARPKAGAGHPKAGAGHAHGGGGRKR